MPQTFNYQGKTYESIGLIKLVQDSFLFAKNDNEITYVKSKSGKDITLIEKMIADKVVNCLKKQNKSQLNAIVNDINIFVNNNTKFLKTIEELNGKSSFVSSNIDTIDVYIDKILSDNEYFKKANKVNLSYDSYPKYNEAAVTQTLKKADESFDIASFIVAYTDDLTDEQIDIILKKFGSTLEEGQIAVLNNQKSINDIDKKQKELQPRAKVKKLQKNKKAAFADSLLLTFIVGTLCGVYLMYFALTVMA